MNRRILVLSILFFYIISITIPSIFSYNGKISNEKEPQSAIQSDTNEK